MILFIAQTQLCDILLNTLIQVQSIVQSNINIDLKLISWWIRIGNVQKTQ